MEDVVSSYSSLYDTSSLLQFCNDDSASAASSMEVTDRIASLEQRVQMQEDELQLLKSALADVVRRLNISEEQQAMQNRKGPTKVFIFVHSEKCRSFTRVKTYKSFENEEEKTQDSSQAPSTQCLSCLFPDCTVKRAGSTERVGSMRRESSGDPKSNRTRTGSTSSNSSGKKTIESYGYRGRDCRSNLYLLPTGETVYFIASVVVLYNVEEQLQRHYTGHNDDVKW
ncbi:UNVERIFIED_CONTAM: hypothetical protein FKN15_072687 [Acipenser sinensis]